jgi:hypothetical protein
VRSWQDTVRELAHLHDFQWQDSNERLQQISTLAVQRWQISTVVISRISRQQMEQIKILMERTDNTP